ncbi:hypothetical protein [Paraburkholderia aromaticivorans]|uniref:hypothetical protein n=1 Tax=Paraburkholderia aromaticivorans TaxID=2026199 RepID=UPI001455F315|nr:hypothetical protein [Paraburkholderia aromaticivorans]
MDKQQAGRAPDWSPAEDALVCKMWRAGVPVKGMLKRLPLRTESAIRKRREKLAAEAGLELRLVFGGAAPKRLTTPKIWKVLMRRPCTRAQIERLAKACKCSVTAFIKENRADIHVCGWTAPDDHGRRAEIFAAGAGADVLRPPRQSRAEIYQRWWQRLKRERPDVAGHRVARDNHRRLMQSGKLIRRDPAAIALFGDAGGAQSE